MGKKSIILKKKSARSGNGHIDIIVNKNYCTSCTFPSIYAKVVTFKKSSDIWVCIHVVCLQYSSTGNRNL